MPDYSGDWKTCPCLSGDWGGMRQKLANKGLTFLLQWFQVGQVVVSGGRNERWAYVANLDFHIHADLMRMDVLPGALISFRAARARELSGTVARTAGRGHALHP